MKALAGICVTLILTIIAKETDSTIWPYARDRLSAGTPAFRDKAGPGFYKVPTSKYDPLLKHYRRVHIEGECHPVECYCFPDDPSYCICFDYLGHIAAIQIGYLKEVADQLDPNLYSFKDNPNYKEIEVFNKTVYSVRIWLTNPEKLTESGRSDLSEIIEGLWVYIDGKLVRFDQRCQPVGPSIGSFDLQGCVPMKGTLYVHNFNKTSCCQKGFFLFLVYDRNSLVGFGHAAPGNFPPGPTRDWFDHPKGEKLARIVPSPPSCFAEILQYGLTSSVTFLVEDPYNIKCPVCGC